MTGKADFTADEWKLVVEGPPTAGLIVITAQRGGTFRETFSIGKSYIEARKRHGESELLDEIVSAKPELDRTHSHSPEELREHGLQQLRAAVELLKSNILHCTKDLLKFAMTDLNLSARATRTGASRSSSPAMSPTPTESAATSSVRATRSAPQSRRSPKRSDPRRPDLARSCRFRGSSCV